MLPLYSKELSTLYLLVKTKKVSMLLQVDFSFGKVVGILHIYILIPYVIMELHIAILHTARREELKLRFQP